MRSPEHIEAYLRIARTMQALKSEDIRWPSTSAEELIREAKAHTGQVVTTLRDEPPVQRPKQRPRVAPFAFAMAAALLVAIGVAWMVWLTPQTFETGFGEQRFVRLDDGSGITLNTASKIEVKLSKGHRVIRLIQGQALFDVAHDQSRPFDVYTGNSILRAVGTRFDVDVRSDRTTVTIVEGTVSLTHGLNEALPQGNTPLLHVSDRVVIDGAGQARPSTTFVSMKRRRGRGSSSCSTAARWATWRMSSIVTTARASSSTAPSCGRSRSPVCSKRTIRPRSSRSWPTFPACASATMARAVMW